MSTLTTDAQIKRRALREVGDSGVCTLWQVALPQSTESGTWTFTFGGQTTNSIPGLADRDVVRLALEGLSSIGSGNVEVTGIVRGPFSVRFVGVLGAQPLPPQTYPLTANGAGLNPAAILVPYQLEQGETQVMNGIADELLADIGYLNNPHARFLSLKLGLFDTLLGESHKGVDVETAQRIEKLAQQHSNLLELRSLVWNELEGIIGTNSTEEMTTTSHVRKIRKTTPNGLPYGQLGRRYR